MRALRQLEKYDTGEALKHLKAIAQVYFKFSKKDTSCVDVLVQEKFAGQLMVINISSCNVHSSGPSLLTVDV